MGQSDDIEDATYRKHQDVCEKLNMDASAAEEAWKSYENIRQNYTLEVNNKLIMTVNILESSIIIFWKYLKYLFHRDSRAFLF